LSKSLKKDVFAEKEAEKKHRIAAQILANMPDVIGA